MDLNNDAILDIVVAGNGNWVMFLANDGVGRYDKVDSIQLSANVRCFALGDLGGDLDLDLVVGTSCDTFYVLQNQGGWSFQIDTAISYSSFEPVWDVKIADIDQDSDKDLVYTLRGNIHVMRNYGAGDFGAIRKYAPTYSEDLSLADYDGDGDVDIAVASTYSDNFAILKNDADTTFMTPVGYSISRPQDIEAVELNGDIYPDLIVVNEGNAHTYFNNGDATFTLDSTYSMYDAYPRSIVADDFDDDGWADIAAGQGDGSVAIFMNNGDSTFQSAVVYDRARDHIRSIESHDFDKDGDPDLLMTCADGFAVTFFENDGSGTFINVYDYAAGESTYDVCLADFDNDDDTDVGVVNNPGQNISLLFNRYEIITDVPEIGDRAGLPANFWLAQNYPNPFNPGTTIEYDLPRRSHVTLAVYNILGREVRLLVNESQSAGPQSVYWDGRDEAGKIAASGVYLYHLKADDTIEARKMILLK
ncbi:MAG: T9SS type A sorting domain-containing protein [bacterium]|nr:T9SS type A sorting domain-containing protein [bacterium]